MSVPYVTLFSLFHEPFKEIKYQYLNFTAEEMSPPKG